MQAGTNLPAVAVAAAAEERLGKPVLANNAATTWRAYRASGIRDRRGGFGPLLRDH